MTDAERIAVLERDLANAVAEPSGQRSATVSRAIVAHLAPDAERKAARLAGYVEALDDLASWESDSRVWVEQTRAAK